ncbi:MAG: Tyrosine-specific transport protein [Chlamydiia bacterium]|nr:Tyrosine-specific transport protein [Chlamydiia bacterium]MCH9615311.1 Tyrosine-specific transport protein [Chlamydiia bacterium]MCH9628367.1 Tyrosine-specific transport protein [Chlamydiia bacterium]
MSGENFRALRGALLISGTMIGAGMLGIPLVTSESGFFPGMLATVITYLFMLATGLLFFEATMWLPDGSNILSISKKFLGNKGKALSGGFFIFLYYCLMIAYFAAGGPLLQLAIAAIFGVKLTLFLSFLIFGVIFGTIVAIGPKSIDRTNFILSIAMVTAWVFLIGVGSGEVTLVNLKISNWSSMSFAFPILFGAFGYHNVIPSLCTHLKRDVKLIRLSIIGGTLLALLVYLVWQWLILGAIPGELIAETLKKGYPVTHALQKVTGHPWIVRLGNTFSFFAIVTSVLGVSFSMVDFLGDGFKIKRRHGRDRIFLTLLTFIPPFLFGVINPHIFDTALGVAGGIGEAVLNGLLPIALVWIGRYRMGFESVGGLFGGKPLLLILTLFSFYVMALELYLLF